ncbi:hypothetical protein [Nitrosomonas ureae]|uniref:hypothetical protein n=1 Tax=Nitrosomonas ureae TaxID=44577 RepID=UPI000BB8D970|nr:hypothetical protein [Nitrosomonas ureae]
MYEAIADQYSRKAAGIKEEAQRRVYILDEYLKLLEGGFKQKRALEIIKSRYQGVSKATSWRLVEASRKTSAPILGSHSGTRLSRPFPHGNSS